MKKFTMRHYSYLKKYRFLFIILIFLGELSCNSAKNNEADLNNQLVIEKETYQMIKHFDDGGKKEQGFEKFNTNESYIKWISTKNFSEKYFSDLLEIDFDKFDLIIYNLGERENKDYRIEIVNAIFEKSSVEFEAKIVFKKETAINEKNVNPYQLIAVPKNKEIKIKFIP